MDKLVFEDQPRPFLRWAGSKRQLIPELSKYWNSKYTRYVEPFAGSASLFFNLSPTCALLGDLNSELIATYKQVKNNLPQVITELKTLRKGKQTYLRLRAMELNTLSPARRAARFIYLNRFCFNGLYRTNNSGKFNVPYGGYKGGKLPSINTFVQCSSILQSATLLAGNFEKTLEKSKSGDFVYMDPPFTVKAKRIFNQYDAAVFDQQRLQLLREWMLRLDHQGIVFLVSYADSTEGDFLKNGFYSEVVKVRRNIAGFAANRRQASELLISNCPPIK